jgi:ribosomal protein S18 acetylase RimI-like enzyme
VPFELARDAEPVLDLFRNNMHWLCADPHCSAEQLLSYVLQLSTAKKPDQLTLKVLRDNAQFVGFIAYHREQKHQGKILLIGVPEHARGKGYGALLIDHALGDLIQRGVPEIVLDTGIDNVTAQRLYKRAGFNVISVCPESQDHLRFGYTVATAQPIVYA